MRFLLLLFSVFFSVMCFAQPDSNVVTFKVDKPDVIITVTPADSVFWSEKRNFFEVYIKKGKSTIARVELTHGNLMEVSPNNYAVRFDTACQTVLKVYEKLPNGKTRLAFSKPYDVKEKPGPVVTIAGVKADSSVGIKRLLHIAALQVDLEGSSILPSIRSFKMVVSNAGREQVFQGVGARLTLSMKNEIRRMIPGQTIEFRDIQIVMPEGKSKLIQSMSVFLVETDEYNIGRSGIIGGP
jgi:hypothetical protein